MPSGGSAQVAEERVPYADGVRSTMRLRLTFRSVGAAGLRVASYTPKDSFGVVFNQARPEGQ